jgi:CheY-like chemotaxis protein
MSRTILAVDVEPMIINAIERVFIDTDYEIISALSPEDGIAALAKTKVDLVIADLMMHPLNGHQFLAKVKQADPTIARILLSAVSDKVPRMQCVADGSVHLYLTKPWDNAILRKKVETIFRLCTDMEASGLKELVTSAFCLPVDPAARNQISQLFQEGVTIRYVHDLVAGDAGLTGCLLHCVNSAFENLSTGSVSRALEYMGIDNLGELCGQIVGQEARDDSAGQQHDLAQLMKCTARRSRYVENLHRVRRGSNLPDEWKTISRLLDTGRHLLLHKRHALYREYLTRCRSECRLDVTVHQVGFPPCTTYDIGALLLRLWNAPGDIVSRITGCCQPANGSPDTEFMAMIHAAEVAAWRTVEGFSDLHISGQICDTLQGSEDSIMRQIQDGIRE